MATSVLDIILRTKKTGTGEKDAGKGLKDLQKAALAVGVAVAGVAAVYQKTVGAAISYNKAILDAAQSTGMGTEEFSRIVQVADDFGISMDEVTRALQLATKNGFAPSIEELARLADRVNKMERPTERAAELAKLLGRNWAVLDPLLQAGGDSIRSMGAAVSEGLIATQKEVMATEKLRLQIDELNDSWQSLALTIGGTIAEYVNEQIDTTTRLNDVLIQTGEYGQIGFLEWRKRWWELNDAMNQSETAIATVAARNSELAPTLIGVGGAAGSAADAIEGLTAQAYLSAAAEATIAGDTAAANHYMSLYRAAKKAADELERVAGLLSHQLAPEDRAAMNTPQGPGVQQAEGGPVMAGGRHLVGERGPEMFVPATSGTIVPNGKGGGVSIGSIVVNNSLEGNALNMRLTKWMKGQGA